MNPREFLPGRGVILCGGAHTPAASLAGRGASQLRTRGRRWASPARQSTLCSFSSGKKVRKESSRSWATTLVNLYFST